MTITVSAFAANILQASDCNSSGTAHGKRECPLAKIKMAWTLTGTYSSNTSVKQICWSPGNLHNMKAGEGEVWARESVGAH